MIFKVFCGSFGELVCSRRSMDRTLPCEGRNAGSIPAGCTKKQKSPRAVFVQPEQTKGLCQESNRLAVHELSRACR